MYDSRCFGSQMSCVFALSESETPRLPMIVPIDCSCEIVKHSAVFQILFLKTSNCFRFLRIKRRNLQSVLSQSLGPENESLQNEADRSIFTSKFVFVLVTKSTQQQNPQHSDFLNIRFFETSLPCRYLTY